MGKIFHDADRCAEAVVDRVGHNLRLAVPIGIGKPILLVDALIVTAWSFLSTGDSERHAKPYRATTQSAHALRTTFWFYRYTRLAMLVEVAVLSFSLAWITGA